MTTVHVVYHRDPDGWWADSPDIPGWSATADSLDELHQLSEDGVRFALDDPNLMIYHTLEDGIQTSGIVFDFVHGETVVRQRSGSADRSAADLRLVATH